MRPLREAQADVLASVPPLPAVPVPLVEARGLVVAQDVVAPHAVPPFANSAMDGFAVIAGDTANPGVSLSVLEDVAAGHVPSQTVETGTAIKIMTGAPMPAGADSVVKVEDTSLAGDTVTINTTVEPGTAVRRAGGDMEEGSVVVAAGERLSAAHVGLLAAVGVNEPVVFRRPAVALLSTGDEVRTPDTVRLEPGQIRDTNRPILAALLADFGADVIDLGIVGDDADLLRTTLEKAAEQADVVITSGGVSMGEYDLVKQVLTDLGEVEFWRVAMQPAKPFAFGSIGGSPLFGLPGNPVSVVVAFEQFARPALLHMMGATRLFRPRLAGTAGEDLETDPEKTVFVRVAVDADRVARTSGGQQSNQLSALAAADAFAVVPVGVGTIDEGQGVELEMFHWEPTLTWAEVSNG